jgi:hypothetical protein
MRKVNRASILSLADYERVRSSEREKAMKVKELRRIHVGPYLTFLFENFETVQYQVHEMIRTERITDEQQIAHELETYNELIGEQGELGCTLLIEIDDSAKRAELLSRWLNLPETLYVKTQDGSKIPPTIDDRQIGEQRISSVHYLRFRLGDKIPVGVGCSFPELCAETPLRPEQSSALCKDVVAR